jgi:hypothetical protein
MAIFRKLVQKNTGIKRRFSFVISKRSFKNSDTCIDIVALKYTANSKKVVLQNLKR